MNIDDVLKVSPALVNGNPEGKSARNAEAARTDQQSSEKVTLSARSAELQSLEARVASEEAFDAAKVEAIKAAIQSGQYKVDSGKVADGLINSVKEMLSGTVRK
ncbi:MAG TPA: flagellar biosynthesis anti-sigma factor FlgM [Methylophilaceae bacterium]|jgi:negative regulator of flagellin synthesis FlgM